MSALINSKMEMLNEDEILSIAAQETGSPYSVEQVKASLLAEVYEGGALLMREGNTFIVVKETNNPDVVVIRPLNADVIENFIDNLIKAMQVQVAKGIPYAVVDFTDERILTLFKAIVKKAKGLINISYSIKQFSNGKYRAILKLSSAGGLSNQENI